MKLWTFLKEQMMKYSNQEICEEDSCLTYEHVVVWAEMFSEKLKNFHCCAILCSSEMIASMSLLSCFAAGVTAVPLSMRYGKTHCDKILEFIRPDGIIMDKDGEIKVYKVSDSLYRPPSEHPALIMCTSGTTGTPKGAMLTEQNILANVRDIADYFRIKRDDSILIARPLYHSAVLTGEFLTALTKGTKIRFYSGPFNPAKMIELISTYRITAFCGTPTLLSLMARFQRSAGGTSLKHICISGECMSKEVGNCIFQAFQKADIYSVYGLTEACPRISYLPPDFFPEYADCVGVPLKSVFIKILREDGSLAKKNQTGILWVRGENVMSGYYNNPKKTAETLRDGWLCTGDIASVNSMGFLKIWGRNDDMIIKGGMNIYPQEIEGVLKADPRVKEALVFEKKDKLGRTQIILNLAGDFSEIQEVRELCKQCLSPYQMPNEINFVDNLPKNGSGKIIRRTV